MENMSSNMVATPTAEAGDKQAFPPSQYSDSRANTGVSSIRPPEADYIDVDPVLRGFKEGMPMRRTYFNTNMGASERSLGAATERSADRSRNYGGIATEVGSSYLAKVNRGRGVFGLSRMSGPACNYQNVDLFKIPENDLRRKFSKRSRSPRNKWLQSKRSDLGSSIQTIENSTIEASHLDLQDEIIAGAAEPEEILQDAITEVKVNRQMQKKYGKPLFNKFQASQSIFALNKTQSPTGSTLGNKLTQGVEDFFKFPQNLDRPNMTGGMPS